MIRSVLEIDIVTPSRSCRGETEVLLELARLVERHSSAFIGLNSCDMNSEFFKRALICDANELLKLSEICNHGSWQGVNTSSEYYREVNFDVLQSFAYRLYALTHFEALEDECLFSDPALTKLTDRMALGIEHDIGAVKMWFVKYGVGKFALDLKDITLDTAKKLNLLEKPARYELGQESEAFCKMDVYPWADVVRMRYKQYLDAIRHLEYPEYEYNPKSYPTLSELRAQWDLDDEKVLPQSLIRVNLSKESSRDRDPDSDFLTAEPLGWTLDRDS